MSALQCRRSVFFGGSSQRGSNNLHPGMSVVQEVTRSAQWFRVFDEKLFIKFAIRRPYCDRIRVFRWDSSSRNSIVIRPPRWLSGKAVAERYLCCECVYGWQGSDPRVIAGHAGMCVVQYYYTTAPLDMRSIVLLGHRTTVVVLSLTVIVICYTNMILVMYGKSIHQSKRRYNYNICSISSVCFFSFSSVIYLVKVVLIEMN